MSENHFQIQCNCLKDIERAIVVIKKETNGKYVTYIKCKHCKNFIRKNKNKLL